MQVMPVNMIGKERCRQAKDIVNEAVGQFSVLYKH